MQATVNIFNDRVAEINLYYEAITQLYDAQSSVKTNYAYFNDDFLKMLKANALMMVYNLIESSVMNGILEIYDQVKKLELSYKDVRKEIKDIWFSYKFNQVYDRHAHYNSYRNKALEILNEVINDEIIKLDRNAAEIKGNLDADAIRNICREHGIVFYDDTNCRGGYVLSDVKDKRNNLSHGTISFVECGRDYSFEELITIKNEVVLYLEGLLVGINDYYINQKFLL